MSYCSFVVIARIICRVTHRYKYLFGILFRVIYYRLPLRYQGAFANTASPVRCQGLIPQGRWIRELVIDIQTEINVVSSLG